MSPAHYRAVSLPVRLGIALGIIAALLVALAPTGGLVEGPARGAPATVTSLELESSIAAIGIVAAVLLAAAAAAPWLWAHMAGLAVTTILAATSGLLVVTARQSDDLAADAEVSLLGGGVMLTVAFWVALATVIVTLVGFRRVAMTTPAPEEPDDEPAATGRSRNATKATIALVLGFAGFLTAVASSLAIAFGALALGEIRASGGRLGGRGTAVAGLVLGMVALSLLAAFVGIGTLAAKPSD